MPGGDRTGPLGLGPGTGRQTGWCGPYGGRAAPAGKGWGAGWFGRGRGLGRGLRCGYRGFGWSRRGVPAAGYGGDDPASKDVALNEMEAYAGRLEAELNALREQMQALQEGSDPA